VELDVHAKENFSQDTRQIETLANEQRIALVITLAEHSSHTHRKWQKGNIMTK